MASSRARILLFGTSALALATAHGALADSQSADTAQPVATAKSVAGASKARAPETVTADAAPGAQAGDNSVQAVVVTGSRITSAGFTAPTPVTVLGQAKIEQNAPSNAFDILSQIPSFRGTLGLAEAGTGLRTPGQALLDLRGLNLPRTLVLIDGLRPTPNNSSGVFDTNMIPTMLIDHIDVVTGGASAAYGSDAIAGVVNFAMKHHLEGVAGNVQYGISEHDDNISPLISLGFGTSFAGGKGHFEIGGDYNRNNGVLSIYDRKWGAQEPGLVSLGATRTPGLPANLVTYHAELDNNSAGGVISAGPLKGTAFDASGNPYQLQIGSPSGATSMVGTTNYTNTQVPGQQLISPYNRTAIMARVEYDVTPDINVHASLNYGGVQDHASGISFTATDIVINAATNPYVPASVKAAAAAAGVTTFTLSKEATPASNLPPLQAGSRQDNWNGVFGIDGKLGGDWKWSATYEHGWTDSTRAVLNDPLFANFYEAIDAVTSPTGAIVCAPVASNPNFTNHKNYLPNVMGGCVPYNPFGNKVASQASVNFIEGASDLAEMVKQDDAQANISGALFNLPAGPLSVAAGVEYRHNSINSLAAYNSAPNVLFNENDISYNAQIHDKEIYGEAEVPLVKDKPFMKELSLNGAIRETDYSTSGSVTTWKAGGVWEPNDTFRFRLTRSRDIRAPNLNELYNPGANGGVLVTNNGNNGQVQTFTPGNPNLVPEVADTWTGGVSFQPTWTWARGFRATVDYFNITVNGIISPLVQQDELNRCNSGLTFYCQFIQFDNSALGVSGITTVPLNLAAAKTSGFDIELDYHVPLDTMSIPGDFNIRALGTRTNHLQVISPLASGGTATVEYAGTAQALNSAGAVSGGQPFWRWNTDLTYTLNRLSINMNVVYASPVKISTTLIGPDDPAYSPTLANSVNKNKLPPSLYFNPNISYDLVRGDGRRLQAYLYISNLLDKNPPLGASLVTAGSPYDLVGRSFKFGLRFQY